MKNISATIDAARLDDVLEGLEAIGVTELIVAEVNVIGQAMTAMYRGRRYSVDFTPKVALEVAVADSRVPDVVEAISTTAGADRGGGREILVAPIEVALGIGSSEGRRVARVPG